MILRNVRSNDKIHRFIDLNYNSEPNARVRKSGSEEMLQGSSLLLLQVALRVSYTKHIDQEGRGAGGMSLHNTGAECGRCPYCKGII